LLLLLLLTQLLALRFFLAAIKCNSLWFLWFFKTFNNILRGCYLSFISALAFKSPLLSVFLSLSLSLCLYSTTFFPLYYLYRCCSVACPLSRVASHVLLSLLVVCVCVCCRCAASGNNSVSSAIWRFYTHTHLTHTRAAFLSLSRCSPFCQTISTTTAPLLHSGL